jgi:hypothetical protein
VLKDAFHFARSYVTECGFAGEIEWQDSVSLERLAESTFLQEYAWVVLASGMREAVVRRKFPQISECFWSWSSAQMIACHSKDCVTAALLIFHHEQKMRAIVSTAELIANQGFVVFKEQLEREPLETLRGLPFIGPITQYHLAKNIGVDVAKPDRHLVRIADLFGYQSVHDFCGEVASVTCSRVAVVDLIFWRFATLERNYLGLLRQFA